MRKPRIRTSIAGRAWAYLNQACLIRRRQSSIVDEGATTLEDTAAIPARKDFDAARWRILCVALFVMKRVLHEVSSADRARSLQLCNDRLDRRLPWRSDRPVGMLCRRVPPFVRWRGFPSSRRGAGQRRRTSSAGQDSGVQSETLVRVQHRQVQVVRRRPEQRVCLRVFQRCRGMERNVRKGRIRVHQLAQAKPVHLELRCSETSCRRIRRRISCPSIRTRRRRYPLPSRTCAGIRAGRRRTRLRRYRCRSRG